MIVVGRCVTCQWCIQTSGPSRFAPDTPVRYRCTLASSFDGSPAYGEALATAHDCEAYAAHLEVKPEFGCVSWVAK